MMIIKASEVVKILSEPKGIFKIINDGNALQFLLTKVACIWTVKYLDGKVFGR